MAKDLLREYGLERSEKPGADPPPVAGFGQIANFASASPFLKCEQNYSHCQALAVSGGDTWECLSS